ncbi:MAG: Gfo/Idh/MocA family oxidoreductase [Kiritimatiellaeota bacterium]|nr:Gfo/Idh/MocA family oxidoreductase [Kiritimatiellota bacterium]
MKSLLEILVARPQPIRVAIVGAGEFGAEMATQIACMRNIRVDVIGDTDTDKARAVFVESGIPADTIRRAQSGAEAQGLIEAGYRVVTDNALEIPQTCVDAVCDATGNPYFGAELAHTAIANGKHVIVVNIESDVGTGYLLRAFAEKNGVVYTEADGDQPSLIKALCDWCDCLGIGVVTAGKWTTMHPEELRPETANRVSAGYFDGSKNQVEMCCVANMTGLPPDIRGMHRPTLALNEIADVFAPKSDGGILDRNGVVDVVNCLTPDGKTYIERLFGGGVFVVAECPANPRFSAVIRDKYSLRSKDGKRALLFRPHHLVGIEAPMSILKAVLLGEATGAPLREPVAEVIAIAKTDLPAGTILDGIGGRTVRGEIEHRDISDAAGLLPLCMAEGVRLNRAVAKNTALTLDMLAAPGDGFIWKLRNFHVPAGNCRNMKL